MLNYKTGILASQVGPPAVVSAACFIVGPVSFAVFLLAFVVAIAVLWSRV